MRVSVLPDCRGCSKVKRCSKCKTEKDVSEFYRSRSRPDGRSPVCKACKNAGEKISRDKHRVAYLARKRAKYPREKSSRRYQRILRVYGIDQAAYEKMSASQGGVCAICGGTDKCALSVDHDHSAGSLRALLCNRCNLLLGNVGDSAEILQSAIHYLARHKLRLIA